MSKDEGEFAKEGRFASTIVYTNTAMGNRLAWILSLVCHSHEVYDSILVFVDRLTKYVILVPTHTTLDATGFAQLFIDNVVTFGMRGGCV
jgi:hypothetical protein